ncbi:hypothetical protein [Pseudoduganella rhizocola]|uniref:hypothetical protein n=1 Tax=Pseudoduganella rhizocola TaxID=3382643 RepID=UPI0038B46F49
MWKAIAAAMFAALLAGCAAHTPILVETAGPKPTVEQADAFIKADLRRNLRDPDSLRDYAITRGPELLTATNFGKNLEQAYVVCVEYNSKNEYGGYTGIQTHTYALKFSGDSLVRIYGVNWIATDIIC